MSFLGFLVQFATALYLIYSGYGYQHASMELNGAIVLLCPLLFMFGSAVRHNAKTSGRAGFLGAIKMILTGYIMGLILSAVFFGLGMGLMHVLELSPEPGSGRI
jgi:hypothetical protein